MKKRFASIIGLSMMISMSFLGAIASAATDFAQFGFSDIIAKKEIGAGEAAKISHNGINIEIPEGTFEHDVRFEVLEGDNEDFQDNTPEGETVIMNFALRVTDLETNQIIGKFNKPIMFHFKDKDVNKGSIYYNVTTEGELVNNNGATEIDDKTLSHPIAGAPVGWTITSPSRSIEKGHHGCW